MIHQSIPFFSARSSEPPKWALEMMKFRYSIWREYDDGTCQTFRKRRFGFREDAI
jgi:hypothetical protein